MRTARAKGLAPRTVDRRHVLRNALLPDLDDHRPPDGLLLSGAVLTETVFACPGMGSWLRDAIFNRDYPVLQGGILFLAVVFVLREPARRHLVRDHQPADPVQLSVSRGNRVPPTRSRPAEWGKLWSEAGHRLIRNPTAVIGMVLVSLFVIAAVFAPVIAPYGPLPDLARLRRYSSRRPASGGRACVRRLCLLGGRSPCPAHRLGTSSFLVDGPRLQGGQRAINAIALWLAFAECCIQRRNAVG